MNTYAPAPATGTLPGPYAATPSPDGIEISPAVLRLARAEVRALLASSSAFRELPAERRRQLAHDFVKVASYIAALLQEEFALTEQLEQVPVLVRRWLEPMAASVGAASPAGAAGRTPAGALAAPPPPPPPPPAEEWTPRAAREVAKVTRATLNAIEFPTFVADLIRGTYNAIIDASIKQMEAYAELIANVAKTVDQYMADNISDNQARDYLAETYPGHFRVDTSNGSPRVAVREGAEERQPPNFSADLDLPPDTPVSDETAEETLIPAARRKLARQRQQLLSSMVMMGVNRIVVTSGRIRATMGFRIDAQDHAQAETATEFDEKNYTAATAWFGFGGGGTANSIAYVSSTKKESTDDLTVHADLTGEVDLKFKTDYLPLERMATPQMISAIQGNTPNPPANTVGTGGARESSGQQ